MAQIVFPYVPEYITVHLGAPSADAPNVTVSFPDYIKNVASSEIYPTWEESALYANIYAQISYALNRVYTEFYRAQGYDFQITNNTAYDQKFIQGRNIFENISRIVDGIFNDYIRRIGFVEPLAAKYCNGTTVTCAGLSQWGSQYLAEQGLSSFEILQNYYGDNIELVQNAPVRGLRTSYPGYPISRGDTGNAVVSVQAMLNRISQNYPAIPKVYPADGIFGENTERAVITFQRIFDLVPDGIVGPATWYKMAYLYTGITRLSELESEGLTYYGSSLEYPDPISFGDKGEKVSTLQFMLQMFATFNESIPPVEQTGSFGENTRNAVIAFQREYDLPQTGDVGDETWDVMYRQLVGIYGYVLFPNQPSNIQVEPYPGRVLQLGSTGEDVRTLQQYINNITTTFPSISPINVTGVYGRATRSAVLQFQEQVGLMRTGNVNEQTWNAIANAYRDAIASQSSHYTQFPGYTLRQGDSDFENKEDAG